MVLDPANVPADSVIDPDNVTGSPIGGNRLGIANAEIRIPFPLIPRWRLVGFVDAGAVEPRTASALGSVTRGVALRAGTLRLSNLTLSGESL